MTKEFLFASSAFILAAGGGLLLTPTEAEACPGYAVSFSCDRCHCNSGEGCISSCSEPPPMTCGGCQYGGTSSGCCLGYDCLNGEECC
jgi:hypothetical protein